MCTYFTSYDFCRPCIIYFVQLFLWCHIKSAQYTVKLLKLRTSRVYRNQAKTDYAGMENIKWWGVLQLYRTAYLYTLLNITSNHNYMNISSLAVKDPKVLIPAFILENYHHYSWFNIHFSILALGQKDFFLWYER